MRFLKFFIFLLIFCLTIEAKIIFVVPIGGLDPHKLFYEPYSYRDEAVKPFCDLREALEKDGYTVKITDDAHELNDPSIRSQVAAVISFPSDHPNLLRNLANIDRKKCMMFIFDPPAVLPGLYANLQNSSRYYGHIFLMFDDLVDNQKFFKMYYPQPELKMVEGVYDFDKKKLCTMIAGNKDFRHPNAIYSERRKVIEFYEKNHPDQFDLYGTDWRCKSYKGTVPHKAPVLKKYKFSYCYENTWKQKGYVTEKIFDCLVAGCVPIYLGADNITSYVPKECFVDRRDFSSDEELYQFISSMDRETYEGYIEAILKYLSSPEVQKFSTDHFIKTIKENIPAN